MPALAAAKARTSVYVANGSSVAVIDADTNAIRGEIAVGGASEAVVASKDGTRVYTTHTALDAVSVIDAAGLAVLETIPVGDAPSAAVVSPDGEWLYVSTGGGVVQVIDTVRRSVVASIPTAGGSVGSMAVSADGKKVYLASGPVSVVDTATNTFEGSFLSDRFDIALAPDGSRAYVTRSVSETVGAVDVVDTTSRTVIASVGLGSPGPMALSPDGSRLYVGLAGGVGTAAPHTGASVPGGAVTVIDTLTNTTAANIDIGAQTAGAVVVTPEQRRVYISVTGAVLAADLNTNSVVASVANDAPAAVAASSDGTGAIVPYIITAVDDVAPQPSSDGAAVANVLANDTLGGITPTLVHVTLTAMPDSDAYVTLDTATGAVWVEAGAAPGAHTLVYQVCERAWPENCASATVVVTVPPPATAPKLEAFTFKVDGKTTATPIEFRAPKVSDGGGGEARSEGNVPIGEATATFNVSEAASLLDWMNSILRREAATVEAILGAKDDIRSVTLADGLISELSFVLPKPETTRPFTVIFKWQPDAVSYLGDGVRKQRGAASQPAGFVGTAAFLPSDPILDVRFAAIRPQIMTTPQDGGPPLRSYGEIDADCLKIEVGAASFSTAEQLARKILADGQIDDSEYSDTVVTALDESGKPTAQIVYAAAPVAARLNRNAKTTTVSLVVKRLTVDVNGAKALVGPFVSDPKRCGDLRPR